MNKIVVLILVLLMPFSLLAQDIFGKWKTVDDETGEEKSIVNIYQKEGVVYGQIIDLVNKEKKNVLCDKCEGKDYNKPVIGLVILKDMKKSGAYYKGGTIFDPAKGKEYKCRISLNEDDYNILDVRGYISFLYSTQYWIRIIE
jgi:uncharacterized protein (DUF2147 family)